MLYKSTISLDDFPGSRNNCMSYNYMIVIFRMTNIYLIVMYVVILTTKSMTHPNVIGANEIEIFALLQNHDLEKISTFRKQHKEN